MTNIVTRSGSNDWQASAFLFARNDALDSSNVPNQDAPKLERYQWGGTVGGPVKRDKVFFFGAFEKLDETRGINFDLSKIPPFVASGAATPGGKEDFAIAPETNRWNGMLKLDLNLGPRQRLLVQGESQRRATTQRRDQLARPRHHRARPAPPPPSPTPRTRASCATPAVLSASTFLESSVSYPEGTAGQQPRPRGPLRADPDPSRQRLPSRRARPSTASRHRTSKRFQLAQSFT